MRSWQNAGRLNRSTEDQIALRERVCDAMWNVDDAALERLAIGAGILGTGGGGNPYLGKIHAKLLLSKGHTLTVVSKDEVPDDALITSVGFMGAVRG